VKIAILDDYQDAVRNLASFTRLAPYEVRVINETYRTTDDLVSAIGDVAVLVLIRERTRIDAPLLARLPRLKLISQTGKISNHLDLAACTRAKVLVAEGIGSPVAPSELCWALVMAASRHIPAYVQNLTEGAWQQSGPLGLGRTLRGLTFGIWGYGRIGKRVARYAHAFGMKVLVWGSEKSRIAAASDGFEAACDKASFFRRADVLSLHLRLNDATRGCVTRDDLARMKPDALIVNISRAGLVEENALFDELKAVPTKRAAIDVYDDEPIREASDPLLALPNVLCSPHLGYVEKNSYELYFEAAFENVVNYLEGRPTNIANRELLP
jgi:D-3-phosphoglycerate dehydrogenase / 2-oxoglutarate reductase